MENQSGTISIVNLPGSGSLISRAFQVYKKLFKNLIILSGIVMLSWIIAFGFQSLLNYLPVQFKWPHWVQALMYVVATAISALFYYVLCWMMASIINIVKSFNNGKEISYSQAIKLSKPIVLSVFWVSIVLALVSYSSIIGLVLPILFSVWFYFAFFITVDAQVKGTESLAMSRYLTRGMFFKVLGRSFIFPLLVVIPGIIVLLMMAVPRIGDIFFIITGIALILFSLPFALIFDYLRYQDLLAQKRDQAFNFYSGEKNSLRFWLVLGIIFVSCGYGFSLLSCDAKLNFQLFMLDRVQKVAGIVGPNIQDSMNNMFGDKIKNKKGWVEKIYHQYNSSCYVPAAKGLNSSKYNSSGQYQYSPEDQKMINDYLLELNQKGNTKIDPNLLDTNSNDNYNYNYNLNSGL